MIDFDDILIILILLVAAALNNELDKKTAVIAQQSGISQDSGP